MTDIGVLRRAGGGLAREQVSVPAGRDLVSLYQDTYRAFGWSVVSTGPTTSTSAVTITFARERAARSRPLLSTLQRQADSALRQVAHLEHAPRVAARAGALSTAIVGAVALAGATVLIGSGHGLLGILVAALAVALWGTGHGVCVAVRTWTTRRLALPLDRQYDLVHEACAQAAHLLAAHR